MARSSFLSHARIWERHEEAVLATLERALELLAVRANLHREETYLTRELYFCIIEAYRERRRAKIPTFAGVPTLEGANPPDAEDAEKTTRERKIPDFRFSFFDDLEEDARASAKHYCVECKRIGPPVRSDWVLTKNYAKHGVVRFHNPDHGYGKGSASGAMVGFVQGLELNPALDEVNAYLVSEPLSAIQSPSRGWVVGAVTRLEQGFERPFYVSPFQLRHLWLDIREQTNAARAAEAASNRVRRRIKRTA